MSELKIIQVPKMTNIFGHVIGVTEYYLKSEADKVIARHKYKQCLAMAELCKSQRILCYMSIILHRYDFYVKWHKRWLELAKKFKEDV